MSSQAESEMQNLQRKIKLLESDLEQSEAQCDEGASKLKSAEATIEEQERSVGNYIR